MADVRLAGVRKSFGTTEVLKGIDLEIADGEFVVFVGPSGCGKSTLLRTIAGLEEVDAGQIAIGGRTVNDLSPSDRGIAMVFQSYALYPHMSVYENMAFGLKLAKADKAEIDRRVRAAAETLNITDYLDRKPKALSGGQRQRVAIGRAIVRQPDVFLFDEPLSNLDAELRVHMRVEIARLHKELNATIVYVTHDQVEAMTLADKIVVMRAGIVEQVGAPLALYDDPDNMFVAGFIGSPRMNFLPAAVVAQAEGGQVTVALKARPDTQLTVACATPPKVGDAVTVGVRPEHFLPDGSGDTRMVAHVDVVEHLGNTSYVYAHTVPGEQIIIEQEERRHGGRYGDEIAVGLTAKTSFLFDASGRRIR